MEAESGHGRYCLFILLSRKKKEKEKEKEKRNHDNWIKAHFL